jgi:predicted regulator of amino acid metabolism with ACT domain
VLDLQVITIEVAAAGAPGIIAAVTGLVAEAELSIRQIVSDDPEFSDAPRLYIITDAPVPGSLLRALVDLEFTRSVSVT